MRESLIEKKICDHAKLRGWLVFKATGSKGIPDRIMHKDGKTIYIEVKRTGGKLSKLQEITIKRLNDTGIPATVVYSVEEGVDYVDSQ